MKYKRAGEVILFLGLFLFTYWKIFYHYDAVIVFQSMSKMNAGYVFFAGAAAISFVCAEGAMIWYLLCKTGTKIKILSCIRYSFIGYFFSGITPSATGGQPMQLFFMKKDGIELAESTAILMSVAVAYKFVLVLTGAGLLLFWQEGLKTYLGQYLWLYWVGMLLNFILVLLLVSVMLQPRALTKIMYGMEQLAVRLRILRPSKERVDGIVKFIDSYQETVEFFKNNPLKLIIVTVGTVIQRCSMFFLTWLVYRGFGLSAMNCQTIMALRASIYAAVDMLPFPGSQGITELLYTESFQTIFGQEILPAALCVMRAIEFYLPFCISAGVLVYSRWKKKEK